MLYVWGIYLHVMYLIVKINGIRIVINGIRIGQYSRPIQSILKLQLIPIHESAMAYLKDHLSI